MGWCCVRRSTWKRFEVNGQARTLTATVSGASTMPCSHDGPCGDPPSPKAPLKTTGGLDIRVDAPVQISLCRRKKRNGQKHDFTAVTVTCHIGHGHVLRYISPMALNAERFSSQWYRDMCMIHEFRPGIGCFQTLHWCSLVGSLTDINLDSCHLI